MGRFQSVQPLLGASSFFTGRRDRHDPLPRFGGAFQILLAERADDALIEQGLEMRGIELERVVELRERPVRLLRVVVRHGKVGTNFHGIRVEFQRRFVPGSGLTVALTVKIEVPQHGAHGRIRRPRSRLPLEIGCLGRIERRRCRAARSGFRLGGRRCNRDGRLPVLTTDNPSDQEAKKRAG